MNVHPGDSLPEWTLESVSAEKMKTMAAILHDPNPIHFDVDVVRRLGMGEKVVNQGPNNMAYVMNMLAAWTGDAASVRDLSVRFLANTYAGDRLVAGGTVLEVEATDDGTREAFCEVWLDANGDTRALSGRAQVMLPPV